MIINMHVNYWKGSAHVGFLIQMLKLCVHKKLLTRTHYFLLIFFSWCIYIGMNVSKWGRVLSSFPLNPFLRLEKGETIKCSIKVKNSNNSNKEHVTWLS